MATSWIPKRRSIDREYLLRQITMYAAPWMLALSLTFLICQAILVVFWVDVPNFSENLKASLGGHDQAELLAAEIPDFGIQDLAVWLILLIWPIVIAESVLHWLLRPWNASTRKYHLFDLLVCLCPSLRMCARFPVMGGRLWLPGLGWRHPNKRLRRRLEHHFSLPMVFIALLIMPVLIVEFFMKTQVAQYAWLRMLLHLGTGIIWFAFAAEFIIMFSVAPKKLAYCKRNWIDLAIILLPLFSFLRSLRVLRVSRALKIQQLTKLARAYRLRGTAVKALRALILLEFFNRIVGTDVDRQIAKLQGQLDEVEQKAKELRRAIARLERHRESDAGLIADAAKAMESGETSAEALRRNA